MSRLETSHVRPFANGASVRINGEAEVVVARRRTAPVEQVEGRSRLKHCRIETVDGSKVKRSAHRQIRDTGDAIAQIGRVPAEVELRETAIAER